MVSESRIDVISTSQLVIEGCAPLYRFDRTTIGGGTLGFVWDNMPSNFFYIFFYGMLSTWNKLKQDEVVHDMFTQSWQN